GSTRSPAAFCGLVGMTPSHGRIPHPGMGAAGTAGFRMLTTTVADRARHLDVTAGPDEHDRTSLPPPTVSYERAVEELDVRGLKVAWSTDMGFAVVDPEVEELTRAAADELVAAAGLELLDRPFAPANPLRVWLTAGALALL